MPGTPLIESLISSQNSFLVVLVSKLLGLVQKTKSIDESKVDGPGLSTEIFRGSLDINGSSTISLGAWTSVDCYVSFSSAVPVLHTTSVSDQLSPSLTVSGVFLVPLPDLGTGVSPSALTTVPASGAQFSIIVIGRR